MNSVIPNSCPATHCICTETAPQPWQVETLPPVGTWAAMTLTLSQAVYVFPTTSGNPCPYTKKEDSGPSIWIAPQVEGTCGPDSTFTAPTKSEDPPPLPNLPTLGPQICSLNVEGKGCMCPTDHLPRPVTPRETCGPDLTAPYNCQTQTLKPFVPYKQDPPPDMTAVSCRDPSDGWDFAIAKTLHVIQPGDDTGPGSKSWASDEPVVRPIFYAQSDRATITANCGFWLSDNGKI